MAFVLPILCTLVGLVATLFLLGLLLASTPNSNPALWAKIRAWMITVASVGVLGLVGAIWLMVAGRPATAAGVGAGPAVFCIIAFIVMLKAQ